MIKIENTGYTLFSLPKMQAPLILTPYMRNPIIYFNYVPEDVMQKFLNPLLDAESRANINPILKKTERLHKKLPTDFAIHHAIVTYMKTQKSIAGSLIKMLDILDDIVYHPIIYREEIKEAKKKALKILRTYAVFLGTSPGKTLIQYRNRSKDSALHDLRVLSADDCVLYRFIGPKLRKGIQEIIEDIECTPFIRHVTVPTDFRKSYYP